MQCVCRPTPWQTTPMRVPTPVFWPHMQKPAASSSAYAILPAPKKSTSVYSKSLCRLRCAAKHTRPAYATYRAAPFYLNFIKFHHMSWKKTTLTWGKKLSNHGYQPIPIHGTKPCRELRPDLGGFQTCLNFPVKCHYVTMSFQRNERSLIDL